MLASRRRILLVGIACEFVATLVPPWTRVEPIPPNVVVQSAGFHPIFTPPTTGISQAIDFGRLVIGWLLIALAVAFAWVWAARPTGEDRPARPKTSVG